MFANPKHNLEQVGISPGATVVDLGCGSGHYALLAARMVEAGKTEGTEGKVYAVDVQKSLLDRVQAEAHRDHIHNIQVIWGNFEKPNGTKLPSQIADVVIVSNVLFQVEDKEGFVKEAHRILKPNARLLCIDWSDASGGIGVSAKMLITRTQAEALFINNGFVLDAEIQAGAHHYGIIVRKK